MKSISSFALHSVPFFLAGLILLGLLGLLGLLVLFALALVVLVEDAQVVGSVGHENGEGEVEEEELGDGQDLPGIAVDPDLARDLEEGVECPKEAGKDEDAEAAVIARLHADEGEDGEEGHHGVEGKVGEDEDGGAELARLGVDEVDVHDDREVGAGEEGQVDEDADEGLDDGGDDQRPGRFAQPDFLEPNQRRHFFSKKCRRRFSFFAKIISWKTGNFAIRSVILRSKI